MPRDFRKIKPKGKVLALRVAGETSRLTENRAILLLLAERFPNAAPPLSGSDAPYGPAVSLLAACASRLHLDVASHRLLQVRSGRRERSRVRTGARGVTEHFRVSTARL